jgi:hypothetical protein
MTEHTEPERRCAACGRPAPVEIKQQTAFHVSFLAPAGICRDVIIAATPQEALDKALHRVEMQNNLGPDCLHLAAVGIV